MKPRAIIFDWSGTISNDMMLAYKTNMRLLKDFDKPQMSFEQWKEFAYAGSAYGFLANLGVQADREKVFELSARYIDEEVAAGTLPIIYPWAGETIRNVRQKCRTAVLSSHPQGHLEQDAERYKIKKYFDHIRGGCRDKARYIPVVCKKLGATVENTWYVGDEAADIIAARAAGAFPVAVSGGYSTRERLKAENPALLLDSISDLMLII